MTRKDDRLRHFRPDERMFAERVLDWADQANRQYRSVLTPFLNPREQTIAGILVRSVPDLNAFFDGGFQEAERKRGRIVPPYVTEGDHGLTFLSLEPADRISQLKHPDVLGSLLGLGIKREVVGDILVGDAGCQVVIATEVADFIRMQFTHVGGLPVRMREISRNELQPPEIPTRTVTASVASLRLDAVAAEAFRLSRNKAVTLIKGGKCRVNWKTSDDPAEPVKEGDMLSLRGYGRTRIGPLLGESRKGRTQIQLIRYL